MKRTMPILLAAAAVATSTAVLGAAGSAQAAGSTSPTLNPAPPDYYSCTTNGAGTYCSGETVEPYGPDPSGIFCGSGESAFEVLDEAVRVTSAERWYDREGNIIKRKRVISFEGASVSSPDGVRLSYEQRDIQTDVFPVPGDIEFGTTYVNGSLRITVPGTGAVLVEKGRQVWGTEGELDKESGRHDLGDYFDGDSDVLAGLCAALGA